MFVPPLVVPGAGHASPCVRADVSKAPREGFEQPLLRLAARLQHPNVVPLLAAGERDGLAYYTMPFIEGESLRAHLVRVGRLCVDAAASVLREVGFAHPHLPIGVHVRRHRPRPPTPAPRIRT